MRYLGNKASLVGFIQQVIEKHGIEGEVFADLFAGTAAVGDYFKDRYSIISNDFMYYSYVISKGKLENGTTSEFSTFQKKYGENIFTWLNRQDYTPDESYFVYQNYTPAGNRMFFSEENGIRIDGIRQSIEVLYQEQTLSESEYFFLLASLLGCVNQVSNTSGTYEAFFKFWEFRSKKTLELTPLECHETQETEHCHTIYQCDTNQLIRRIRGDIAYIDPPYTVTQYSAAYHVLETIARYDEPVVRGITGRRVHHREISFYSRKNEAKDQFEDLLRQLDFRHVLISYSNQGLLSLEELTALASLFAVDGTVHIETMPYQEYQNHRSSQKGNGDPLNEVILYFEKDREPVKSPLNYPGSKDTIFPLLYRELPYHIGTFVDVMGGAFNVGVNIPATKEVVYNDYNPFVFEMIQLLLKTDKEELISAVEQTIADFSLEKAGKKEYLALRKHYNKKEKTPLNLFVLHMYAFQNMIRFNNSYKFNTPVGNSGYNQDLEQRIRCFTPRTKQYALLNQDFRSLDWKSFPSDTLFYFDPPYYITKAAYNDGKRGLDGWDETLERELLSILDQLDTWGYQFMLSNVTQHNGKKHTILTNWLSKRDYTVVDMGETGAKYPRVEVLVKNF